MDLSAKKPEVENGFLLGLEKATLQPMPPPYAWRITKYDPSLRNSHGHYLIDEWTSFSDIGKTYGGKTLTYEKDLLVESAYSYSALCFLNDAEIPSLQVSELENNRLSRVKAEELRDIDFDPRSLEVGLVVNERDLEDVVRLNLREIIWCKLIETENFYLHFGWDYYIYIGSISPSLPAISYARRNGLFVEEMISPYLYQDDA